MGLLDSAAFIHDWTAWMERTSRWWIDGIGHFTHHRLVFTARQTEVWDRIQQHPCVWMLRLAEEDALGCHLTKAAKIHDPDMIGNVMDDGKVVAYEQIGQAEPTLEFFDQVENLGLDRNIKCGGWLVANEKIGVARDRSSDRNTLTLATAELVGIFFTIARGFSPSLGERPTCRSSSAIRLRSTARLCASLKALIGSAMMSRTRQRGSRLA
jgi:hypothetical protein